MVLGGSVHWPTPPGSKQHLRGARSAATAGLALITPDTADGRIRRRYFRAPEQAERILVMGASCAERGGVRSGGPR